MFSSSTLSLLSLAWLSLPSFVSLLLSVALQLVSIPLPMASTQLSLLGSLPLELHTALLERLSSQAEQATAYQLTEQVCHRNGGNDAPAAVDEGVLRLGALRLAGSDKTTWTMTVLQKPEPARLSPTVLQRGIIECAVEEGCHPRQLASAFGFSTLAFSLHQRGVRFHRGAVVIDIYQLFPDSTALHPFDPSNYIVSAITRCANPSRSSGPSGPGQGQGQAAGAASAQELKAVAMANISQVQASLKGLVDLQRVE